MSQMHRNRTSLSGAYKKSKRLAESANLDKGRNPSGRGAYEAYPTTSNIFGQESTWKSGIEAKPDMRNAARLRGNKARGTQSSAARVPVK